MAWVVDTCLLIDIFGGTHGFATSAADLLARHADDGLVICPMTYAELAPAFAGDRDLQDEFLGGVGAAYHESWRWEDTLRAHAAWYEHVRKKRAGHARKRPLADVLIGAFACRFQGLLTRNPDEFRATFQDLILRLPETSERETTSS
jgi:predicted nucleic acid-binding protein